MLLDCEIVKELWGRMEGWIFELGMVNYHLSNRRIVLGDLENALAINTIILLTKNDIYNSMKKEQRPTLLSIKHDTKNFISKKNTGII